MTITPSREEQVTEGLFDKITVVGDANLLPINIKKGVQIFGVNGVHEGNEEIVYTEIEYLTGTGAQYIDTGVNPTSNTKIEMTFAYSLTGKNVNVLLFGGADQYMVDDYTFFLNPNTVSCSVYGTQLLGTDLGLTVSSDTKHTLVRDKNLEYVDGELKKTFSEEVFASPASLFLFGIHRSGNYIELKDQIVTIYGCKIWESDVLLRDYIPVVDADGVVCLFDRVTNEFYYNGGTGVFIGGPAVDTTPEYEQLENYTMLYDLGNECTDVTGGWRGATYYSNAVVAKYDTYVHLHTYRALMYTSKTIDFSDYVGVGMFGNNYYLPTTASASIEFIAMYSSSDSVNTGMFKDYNWGRHLFYTCRTSSQNNLVDMNNFYKKFSVSGSWYLGIHLGDSTSASYINLRSIALFREDDWPTLASIAGISANSIDDILNESEVLLSNKDAIEFMIYRCTGSFMASAVTSDTFLTALNNSSYKTIIQANEHWAKFLALIS